MTNPQKTLRPVRGKKASLSPADRKRIAAAAAAVRWGNKIAEPTAPGPYPDLEPMEAVLKAAAKIFLTEGYEAPTMRRISSAAGVGLQTIYRFYPTKHALYLACCASVIEKSMAYFQDLMARNSSPEARICAIALGLGDQLLRPHMTRLIYREQLDPTNTTIDAAFGQKLPRYYETYFDAARALRVSAPETRVIAMISQLVGVAHLLSAHRSVNQFVAICDNVETLSTFALTQAFPGFDWDAIRRDTVFFPFDDLEAA